jgi:hypothetical protein
MGASKCQVSHYLIFMDHSSNLRRFLIDDIEDEWLNGDDFDFVHLRNMIPILKSPVLLLKQVYA